MRRHQADRSCRVARDSHRARGHSHLIAFRQKLKAKNIVFEIGTDASRAPRFTSARSRAIVKNASIELASRTETPRVGCKRKPRESRLPRFKLGAARASEYEISRKKKLPTPRPSEIKFARIEFRLRISRRDKVVCSLCRRHRL